MAEKAPQKTRATSGKVLLSFLHVFEPKAINDGDDEKYSVSVIINKKDKYTLAAYRAAIKAVEDKVFKEKYKGIKPKKWKNPLRDGDDEDEDRDDSYANSFFIGANSKRRPKLYDKNLEPITDDEELYSGCYGRVCINFYAYDVGGNRGVAAGLESIMKISDGTPLGGGGGNPEEDFADSEDFMDDDDDEDFDPQPRRSAGKTKPKTKSKRRDYDDEDDDLFD